MCIVSGIVIGTTGTFMSQTDRILISFEQIDKLKSMNDSIWISNMTAIFTAGLLHYFFKGFKDGYFYLFLASISALIGFFLAMISELLEGMLLYNAAIFIAIAHGICWVIVPQTILAYGGPQNFVLTWGFALLCDFVGLAIFRICFVTLNILLTKEGDHCIGSRCSLFGFLIL